jgi:hypothetical protein
LLSGCDAGGYSDATTVTRSATGDVRTRHSLTSPEGRTCGPGFREQVRGKERRVILGVSTVSIVAIAAVVIVALIVFMYVVPRGGRRRRPKL